jgi:hypothetical protein
MELSVKSKLRRSAPLAFRPILRRSVVVSLQIIAAASFLFRAAAQMPAPASAAAVAPSLAPVITFDQNFFDFGKIKQKQTVIHGFKVSNTGNAPLHIKAVHANCGCTSTVVGKMNLEPGESTEIEAALHFLGCRAQNHSGDFRCARSLQGDSAFQCRCASGSIV